CRGNVH
ncbi:putative aTPase, partial [Vibrio parahaemolyticus V-223/04]